MAQKFMKLILWKNKRTEYIILAKRVRNSQRILYIAVASK